MKKIALLLLLPLFIACSSDDNEGDPKETPLNITNEQIAGTYTLSKAVDKGGKTMDYGCEFSKVYYILKADGDAVYNRCSDEYARTWKRDKNNITILGEGLTGAGHSYKLQTNQNNSNIEIVLNSNTETVVYSKN